MNRTLKVALVVVPMAGFLGYCFATARATHARKVIFATGYYDRPIFLNVPGEELPKVIHYYKEPHPYYNHDVLVVGGKNSAAISALSGPRFHSVMRPRRSSFAGFAYSMNTSK